MGEQKVEYEKELDAVPGLIGENQRIMGECKQGDTVAELTAAREFEIGLLVDLAEQRATVLKAEQVREDAKEKVNTLKGKLAKREGFLAGDTSGTQPLCAEVNALAQKDGELRRAVDRGAGEHDVTRDGADVHEVAVPLLEHGRVRGSDPVEHTLDVHVDHAVPLVGSPHGDGREGHQTRVVDPDVDASPGSQHLLHCSRQLALVADVAVDGQCWLAQPLAFMG